MSLDRQAQPMRTEARYLNGIFREVLDDIAKIHENRPNLELFLQPYTESPITHLRDNPPEKLGPVRLYASTSVDLRHGSFVADIIRWEDKTTIAPDRRARIRKRLADYQPTEEGLYNVPEHGISRHLIGVRRMKRLDAPFAVGQLIKTDNSEPLGVRATAGGWAYVFTRPDDAPAAAAESSG